jgi:hypothetical protein
MLLEGVVVPFRWVRHGGRTGAGGIVSNNVTSHHAHYMYNAGDGCTVAGCSNSAGVGFLGCVRRSVWRGFSFHPSARGVLGHLMLRSGSG